MANRSTLHRSKLDELKAWLLSNSWTLDEKPGDFQVIKARKTGRRFPFIVYDRLNGDHFAVADRDTGVLRTFINCTRKQV